MLSFLFVLLEISLSNAITRAESAAPKYQKIELTEAVTVEVPGNTMFIMSEWKDVVASISQNGVSKTLYSSSLTQFIYFGAKDNYVLTLMPKTIPATVSFGYVPAPSKEEMASGIPLWFTNRQETTFKDQELTIDCKFYAPGQFSFGEIVANNGELTITTYAEDGSQSSEKLSSGSKTFTSHNLIEISRSSSTKKYTIKGALTRNESPTVPILVNVGKQDFNKMGANNIILTQLGTIVLSYNFDKYKDYTEDTTIVNGMKSAKLYYLGTEILPGSSKTFKIPEKTNYNVYVTNSKCQTKTVIKQVGAGSHTITNQDLGECQTSPDITVEFSDEFKQYQYEFTYRLNDDTEYLKWEGPTLTKDTEFTIQFYVSNAGFEDCENVPIGEKITVTESTTVRFDYNTDMPHDKCGKRKYSIQVRNSLEGFDIFYRIDAEDLKPLSGDLITHTSTNIQFLLVLYATNSKLANCNEVEIYSGQITETETKIEISGKDIPDGKCLSQYTANIELKSTDFTEQYKFYYKINDNIEFYFLDEMTISQSEAFNLSIYVTGNGIPNCDLVLLASPFEIKDNTKETTITLSKKDIPDGYCEVFNPNEETQELMDKYTDLQKKNGTLYEAKDGESVTISNENAQITSTGSVTVKCESLSVGAISVNDGTVTIQGPLLTNVFLAKGKIVLHCDASTKTMPFGSIESASSKLLDKEIKIDTLDIEIKMDGKPEEDFLLAIGTVSGFQPNLITNYKFRPAKPGDVVYVAGFGNIQYDAFVSQYPDMYVLEVTSGGGGTNVGLIVGIVVAVVVVIVVVVVVVIVVLKKKKNDNSSH
ncbi:hypothetical protein TRFO_42647 [Tritrichomonas foetus]|uniref:Uncharacterized protein n=1 Tax=Tritrichomonas foetus TaxID=1144522 RepID=A0A1J4KZT3_9EUKA|nr:hypothetical protein TRFO_42647 [Tritrichomonas foetus]|eukprot:OHT15214.1 hypothetical protein TRFO_42647 [Tritrichomonas foetus]